MPKLWTFLERTFRRTPLRKPFFRNASGSAATIFALSAIPMVLAVGGAVDYARYYDAQQSLQTALDAAVLAGASAGNLDTVAKNTFASWTVKVDGTVGAPSFCVGKSASSCDTSQSKYFSGSASGTLNLYFTRLAGIKTVSVHAYATAEHAASSSTSSGGCLWVTGNNSGKVNVNGGTLNAATCQVNSKSTNDTVDAKMITPKFCTATALGGGTISNAYNNKAVTDSSGNQSLSVSCTSPDIPYAGKFTAPTNAGAATDSSKCISISSPIESNKTLSPGVYCSALTVQNNAKITLNPGTYILKGASWLFNSGTSLTGTGVTFYFMYGNIYNNVSWCNTSYSWCWTSGVGSIHLNGSATSTLSAPTSGDCTSTNTCGVLMYSDTSAVSGTMDSANGTWTGIIYLPYHAITFNGGSAVVINGTTVLAGLTSSESLTVSNGSSSSSSTSSSSVVRLIK